MLSEKSPAFSALLKTADGAVIGEGEGTILRTERAVNFISDFVPLYPIGTPLEIDRLFRGQEIHRFRGKVFLSDRTLLRLVSVQDELLPGSECVYCGDMAFPAHIRTIPLPPPKPRFTLPFSLPFLRKPVAPQPKQYDVCIISLTMNQLEFLVTPPSPEENQEISHTIFTDFSENNKLILSMPNTLLAPDDSCLPSSPPIPETSIIIDKRYSFGEKTSCLCHFAGLPARDQQPLQDFLWHYNLSRNQLF